MRALAVTVAVTGATLILTRAHYFVASDMELLRSHFGVRWWWHLQQLLSDPVLGSATEHYMHRQRYRFASDMVWVEGLVQFADWTGIRLMTANLLWTGMVGALGATILVGLGVQLFGSLSWAAVLALVVFMTPYGQWLTVPVFLPKMLGYALFPLVLLTLVRALRRGRGYLAFTAATGIALTAYPASPVYYIPVLVPAAFALLIRDQARGQAISGSLPRFLGSVAGIAALMLGFFLLDGSAKEATSLSTFANVYSTVGARDRFDVASNILRELRRYGDFFILPLVGAAICLMWGTAEDRRPCLLNLLLFLAILAMAKLALALAPHIAVIRLVWLWRVRDFAIVPAIILILFGLRALLTAPGFERMRRPAIIGAALLALWLCVRPYPDRSTAPGPIETWSRVLAFTEPDPLYRELTAVIEAVRRTGTHSRILMPPLESQNTETEYIEALAHRAFLLSNFDSGVVTVRTELTAAYDAGLREYAKIMSAAAGEDRSRRLTAFAVRQGATHVLLPAAPAWAVSLPPVFQRARWTLYGVPQAADGG